MSSFQRIRAEANFAALHRTPPTGAPITSTVIDRVPTITGFDRLRAELTAKRANAKLASEGK